LNARFAPGPTSLRRLVAAAALVAGFAAFSAPARADDPVTVGDYSVNTTPPPSNPDSYGTGSYGTGGSTDSYGTGSYGTGGSGTDSYGTGGTNPNSYGTG
jgi:hypothetical protein